MSAAARNAFLRDYTVAIRDGLAAVLIGAGISRKAGYVDWKQLLQEVASDLDLDVSRESDLVALAQFHLNDRKTRDRLNQLLIDEFLEDAEFTESHRLIASLPIDTIWTTNYDVLIEKALEDAGKRVSVKRRDRDFMNARRRTDVTVYKMHGDRTDPSEAVLIKEDYESYPQTRPTFTISLKGDLATKTFLFLGVSFADPNLLYLLSWVKQLVEANGRQHYCVIRQPKPDDYPGAEYDVKRFPHWVSELRRYNIQPILIDSYDEVEGILLELNRRCRLRNVFIAGSYADAAPLGGEKLGQLCRQLGQQIIKNDCNIISGFGVGVGGDVVLGAMQTLRRNDDERLQLRPFPQNIADPAERAKFWTEYRQRMLGEAGVCVVISGNKNEGGTIAEAVGVVEEVEIARKLGRVVIPIGATGFVAKKVWDEANRDPKSFFGNADVAAPLATLGDENASTDKLVSAVIEIIKIINK